MITCFNCLFISIKINSKYYSSFDRQDQIIITLHYQTLMEQLDTALYYQMGFTEPVVKKAVEYSKTHKVDIFDALQIVQKQDSPVKGKSNLNSNKNRQQNYSGSSILIPIKKINLSDYQIVFSRKASRMSSNMRKIDIRQKTSPVGLYNVSNCCYLNSLLQCYFLMPNFMKYILEGEPLSNLNQLQKNQNKIKIKMIKNQYNLLLTLKDMFSKMTLSSKKHLDPSEVLKNLVDSVGQKIQYGEEKDLFEINISIIERLNECLLYTAKYYRAPLKDQSQGLSKPNQLIDLQQSTGAKTFVNNSKIRQIDNIKRLFYGKKIEFIQNVGQKVEQQEILSDFLGIIINPSHGNFYKALDEEFHYDVQVQVTNQNKKGKLKKHTFIRQVPEYMFFYINRTSYNAQQKQALKNQEKLSFDFVIYLDRYLQKYRQQEMLKNPLITQLLNKKNKILKQKHHFELLIQKIQQCYQHAEFVQGWIDKLPNQKQLQQQKIKFEKQLKQIQQQLQKVQSRRQKYYLMYIFVHRGDAVSGHYWGYGRNGNSWYRFDVNCTQIKQQQILVDLYKSGGTPYALVYAKQSQLYHIPYQYYHDFSVIKEPNSSLIDNSQHLVDLKESSNKTNLNKQNYFTYIPLGLKQVIISQNIRIYQQYLKRKNVQIMQKTLQEYRLGFNLIRSQVGSFNQIDKKFKSIPPYAHFSMYLWFHKEKELAKYNIFSTSLLIASNMQTKQLIQNQALLNLIQKEFKKKIKGQMSLKHFAIQCEPKQYQKYKTLFEAYYYEKQCLKLTLKLIKFMSECQKQQKQELATKLKDFLQIYLSLKVNLHSNQSYMIHLLKQLIYVCLIKCSLSKIQIKISQTDIDKIVSPLLKKQLCALANMKMFSNQLGSLSQVKFKLLYENMSQVWTIQGINKFENNLNLQKRFNEIMPKLKSEIAILKKVQKQQKLVKITQKGDIQEIKQQKKIQTDLI